MRAKVCAGVIVGLSAGLSLMLRGEVPSVPEVTPDGSVVCEDPVFDFGEVLNDQPVNHAFRLKNRGPDRVRILNVRAGCGCMTALARTNSIAPGDTAEIGVVMDLKARKGPQRKAVYVETDSTATSRIRLEMRGTAVSEIDAEPAGVHFGTVAATGMVEREVMISGRSNTLFRVTGVESRSSLFSVAVETVDEGHRYRIRIQCMEPRAAGSWTTTLQVQTDHKVVRTIAIPVGVFVAGEVVAVPSTLYLVSTPGGTNAQLQFLTVYSPSGKPFKLGKIDVPSSELGVSFTNVVSDRHRIEVGARGSFAGLDGKVIRIATDVETVPEIQVPLRVVAGPGTDGEMPEP